MKINYGKKIQGLCYVEDVLNESGVKAAKVMFDNNCKLIKNVNDYLKELRITRTSSYNSINRIAYDLCYFYDFLLFSNKTVNDVDYELLNDFITFLTKIKKNNREYSIEKTLLESLDIEKVNKKVAKIRTFGYLKDQSIARILIRVIDYLQFLNGENIIAKTLLFNKLKTKKNIIKLVKAVGIQVNYDSIEKVDRAKIITASQINIMSNHSSRRNDYLRFLCFILEITGMRIGEALGLKIESYDLEDIRNIKGDIFLEEDTWKVRIYWDKNNPTDSLSKSREMRYVGIEKENQYEFESLLDRYMKFREKKIKQTREQIYFLFVNSGGAKLTYDTASKRFKRILERECPEAVDISFHSYRHALATNKLLDGYPLELVALMLGHSSPITTYKMYIHYSGEDMKEVREKYSNYAKKILEKEAFKHGTYK